MTKTKWWLRLVGSFYLLLVAGSFWVLFINPRLFGDMFPYATDETAVRAFSDAWLIFVLEMLVLGIIMLYASRKPERNGILVVTIAILELIRGAGGDLLWMMRGYPTTNYIPFMMVHIIIAITGIFFLRQEAIKSSGLELQDWSKERVPTRFCQLASNKSEDLFNQHVSFI
jgi:hypothetical protein